MTVVERRTVRLEDRPIVCDAPAVIGGVVVGPLPDEIRIVDDVLRDACRSLVWVEQKPPAHLPGVRRFTRVTHDTEVFVSGGWFPNDDRFWLHVSAAGRLAPPAWYRLREVKHVFVGDDRVALQVFPRAVDYVNIHPHALHLWCCLSEDVVPNFGEGGSI